MIDEVDLDEFVFTRNPNSGVAFLEKSRENASSEDVLVACRFSRIRKRSIPRKYLILAIERRQSPPPGRSRLPPPENWKIVEETYVCAILRSTKKITISAQTCNNRSESSGIFIK